MLLVFLELQAVNGSCLQLVLSDLDGSLIHTLLCAVLNHGGTYHNYVRTTPISTSVTKYNSGV